MAEKKVKKCWRGYERVPGKKAGSSGSCIPKKVGSSKKK